MPVFPSATTIPPAGDLLTDSHQYQWGEVLMGAGTPIKVEKVAGLLGHAETRLNDIDRQNSHGSIPNSLLWLPRTVQFDLAISSQIDYSTVEDILDSLSDAFQPPKIRSSTELSAFAYWRPGREPRQFFGRGTKMDFDSDWKVGRGLAKGSVELVFNDPISYSLEATEESVTLGVGESSDSLVAVNEGNCKNGSPPLIYIAGACTNPRIANNADDNRQIRIDVVLASNQILRINVDTHEVAIQTGGGSNPWVEADYSIVRDDNQFWHLMPGSNTITLQRSNTGAACTMTVEFFDAWARG